MNRKDKLEKALKLGGVASAEYRGADYVDGSPGFETARACENWLQSEQILKFENKRLAPLHAALLEAVEALEMGAFHHPSCGWYDGKDCHCANSKCKEALSKIDKALGDKSR